VTGRVFAVLSPCARPGCRRLCHLRYCPDHVDQEQAATSQLLDETLRDLDLTRDRERELVERVDVLERTLGVRRRPRE
jgi:hypothetical protein